MMLDTTSIWGGVGDVVIYLIVMTIHALLDQLERFARKWPANQELVICRGGGSACTFAGLVEEL